MKLIVGLGNPGTRYEKTRHNLGFMVAEQLVKDFEPVGKTVWSDERKFKSDILELEWQPKVGKLEKIIIAKPKTYMNNSGMAVILLTTYYKLQPSDVWIVHDDIDLPLGSMKIRFGGAAAGHHGVESVMNDLKTDKFWRFRLGIGVRKNLSEQMDRDGKEHTISRERIRNTENFVLGNFSAKEKSKARKLIKNGSEALQTALEKGLEKAMNRYNTK